MSDTSAIDQGDDADTKTTPDQPGQPNTQRQPQTWRPPPWLPTPIGVLASQLSQAAQGRPVGPLPQPAPLPPFDQAQQRAQQREAPYARPTGAFPPYRESPVQTYVPARPTRDPHEWGASEPYANTPATWELPGMWQGIGQRLSQTGSGVVAGLAGTLLAPLTGSMMKSYVAGQTARIKLDHERAVDAAWQVDRQLDVELRDARDAAAIFGGDVGSMTGVNAQIKLKGVGDYMDANRAIAAKNNDYYLQAAIDSGDVNRVLNLWKERDATSRDLKASLAQQTKAEAQAEADAPYLEQPVDAIGVPESAPPAAAAPTAKPDQTAPAPPAAKPDLQQSSVLREAQSRGFRPDSVNDAAESALTGETKAADFKNNRPDLWPLVEQRKREIEGQARAIAANPNLKAGPNSLAAINKLSPTLGTDVDSLVNGDMPISARGNNEYQRLLVALARKVNPAWSPQSYANIAEFQNPNGRTQLKITRAATVAQSGKQVLDDLKAIPDSASAIDAALKRVASGIEGRPEYKRLYADWLTYNIDANVLKTGGAGSVTETGLAVQTVPQFYGTKDQYRAVVQADMGVAKAAMDESRVQWRAMGVTRPMFGEDPAVTETIERIAAGDPALLGGRTAPAPVQVTTPEDVSKLTRGTPFIIPDGPHKGETGYAQ